MPTPKLSEEKRDDIENELLGHCGTNKEIAARHNVSQGTVSNIKAKMEKVIEKPDPTNKRILKLEAENLALRDDNQRCQQAYKAAQRENSVFAAMSDELQKVITPLGSLPTIKKYNGKKKVIQETLVAHLSDEHADQIVLPHQVGGLERYDFRIASRRAETYIDSLLKFSQKTLSNYQFDRLWIFANGDHVSGEIHNLKDHSQYRNAFRNALAIGQLHALMLRDLAPHFKEIKILYLPGNHGRRSIKKDYHGAWDNWDYLVAETARLHCINVGNIEFMIPDSYSACVEIEGFNFAVTHGDEIRSWNSIPWYGIERKTRRLAALSAAQRRRIDYYCFAHFHAPATQDALGGETIINGSWMATSPFAYEKMSVYTEPSQWLHGVHRDYGISWRVKMRLRTPDEHLGPLRYHVTLAKEL